MECGALDFSFLVLLLILSLGLVLRQSAAHMVWFSVWFSKAKELPYLPDEVLLNCLARLSRSNYPNLSLVSKRFRSLIASKELYNTRSILGTTESCLYLSLETNSSSGYKPLLFTLRERTTRTSLNQFPSRFLPRTMHMVSVPTDFTLSPPRAEWVTFAIGSDIYMIGGSMIDEPSPSVFVMDCSSHTWRQAPSMLMPHRNPFVAVHDGKIYVTECHSLYSRDEHKVVQVFDPKAQVWEYLPNQENIQMFMEDNGISWKCYCDVDDVRYLYLPAEGYLKWRDRDSDSDEESSWRTVKGCEHLRNPLKGGETYDPRLRNYDYARLMNYGGKIAVFWIERDKDHMRLPKKEKKKIWYAEITIEKRNGQEEIHGKVKYHGVVFTFPKSSPVEQFLVSTV